jgi:hypothetical protein
LLTKFSRHHLWFVINSYANYSWNLRLRALMGQCLNCFGCGRVKDPLAHLWDKYR